MLVISHNSQRLLFSGFRIEMEVAVLGLDYEVTKNYLYLKLFIPNSNSKKVGL